MALVRRVGEWNHEYSEGKWQYLTTLEQAARYGVVAAMVRQLGSALRLLDAGCGEGALLHYLRGGQLSAYLGVDFSDVAVQRAMLSRDGCDANVQVSYSCRDIAGFEESDYEAFDVVVFNEVLYALHDPVESVSRALSAGGGRAVVYSITAYHESVATLIGRVFRSRALEVVECRDTKRGKAWTIGLLQGKG